MWRGKRLVSFIDKVCITSYNAAQVKFFYFNHFMFSWRTKLNLSCHLSHNRLYFTSWLQFNSLIIPLVPRTIFSFLSIFWLRCSRSPCEPCRLSGHGDSGQAACEEVPSVRPGTVSRSFCWILCGIWVVLRWVHVVAVQENNYCSFLFLAFFNYINNDSWLKYYFFFYMFNSGADALMDYTNGEFAVTGANATANIFASYPSKHLSIINGFVDQVSLNIEFSYLCNLGFM